jgi:transposase-like protein
MMHSVLVTCWRSGGSTGWCVAAHLLELMAEPEAERIVFHNLTESVDTTTPGGKLVFPISGSLAEFEHNLIRERTYAGLAAPRARGKRGGRRKKLGGKQRAAAVDLYRQKKHTIDENCKAVGISRPALYKYVAQAAVSARPSGFGTHTLRERCPAFLLSPRATVREHASIGRSDDAGGHVTERFQARVPIRTWRPHCVGDFLLFREVLQWTHSGLDAGWAVRDRVFSVKRGSRRSWHGLE